MSERQVGYYSPEDVADGWLRAELGRTTDYKLDTLARPSVDANRLDVPAIMHRHVEKFWQQDQDPMARAKWLIGKRAGRAWDRFKKWYNEYPLVLIPRVDIDNSQPVRRELWVSELCRLHSVNHSTAIEAANAGRLKAWRPAGQSWMTNQENWDNWMASRKRRAVA